MLGSIIGGALKVGGTIFGGASAARKAREARRNLESAIHDNENWYAMRYNEDMTARADAMRVLNESERRLKERTRQAAASAAVTGKTNESVAADKAQAAQTMADATAQIAAAGADRKDKVEATYLSRKDSLNEALRNTLNDQAKAVQKAAAGTGDTAGSILKGVLGGYGY